MTTATTGNRNWDDEDGGGERAEGCGKAARAHHEGACGPDGRECGIPVADCERRQAVDAEDAGEGRGGLGRGPRTGDRLPPGRRRDRREQLHQGARTHAGHDHAGPGRPRWGVLQLHDAGGPGPPEHGRQGPGQGGVGVARPRRRSRPHKCANRQGCRGGRGEQLHPGAGQGVGHEPAGPGRPRGRLLRLHVAWCPRGRHRAWA